MTEEDKDLLLKDLCARLPYGVKLDNGLKLRSIDTLTQIVSCSGSDKKIDYIKPYLRPLSSMTEDEKNELNKHYLCITVGDHITLKYHSEGYWDNDTETEFKDYLWLENWFNEHHFDFRGLIFKGLATAVTEENNPYK